MILRDLGVCVQMSRNYSVYGAHMIVYNNGIERPGSIRHILTISGGIDALSY